MRYLRAGCGPALVLIHGLLGYSFSWRFNIPAFSRVATIYAPDLLGCGFSDRPGHIDAALHASAERLWRFLDEIGVSSCDLLGTSRGGAVVMTAAALRPRRVRRLILPAPVNPYSEHGKVISVVLSAPIISALLLRLRPVLHAGHGTILRRLYGDPRRISPGTLEGYARPFERHGVLRHALRILRTWNRDLKELQALLPQITAIPTLLLWGSLDTAVPLSSSFPLRQQFRDCRLVVFDGAGHLPYEEVPDDFNRAVLEFLNSPQRH